MDITLAVFLLSIQEPVGLNVAWIESVTWYTRRLRCCRGPFFKGEVFTLGLTKNCKEEEKLMAYEIIIS